MSPTRPADAATHYDTGQFAALVCTIALVNAYNRLNLISRIQGGDHRLGQWGGRRHAHGLQFIVSLSDSELVADSGRDAQPHA